MAPRNIHCLHNIVGVEQIKTKRSLFELQIMRARVEFLGEPDEILIYCYALKSSVCMYLHKPQCKLRVIKLCL